MNIIIVLQPHNSIPTPNNSKKKSDYIFFHSVWTCNSIPCSSSIFKEKKQNLQHGQQNHRQIIHPKSPSAPYKLARFCPARSTDCQALAQKISTKAGREYRVDGRSKESTIRMWACSGSTPVQAGSCSSVSLWYAQMRMISHFKCSANNSSIDKKDDWRSWQVCWWQQPLLHIVSRFKRVETGFNYNKLHFYFFFTCFAVTFFFC